MIRVGLASPVGGEESGRLETKDGDSGMHETGGIKLGQQSGERDWKRMGAGRGKDKEKKAEGGRVSRPVGEAEESTGSNQQPQSGLSDDDECGGVWAAKVAADVRERWGVGGGEQR
ncbi:hypothetical protein AcV5_004529 [Taiwanofungus camphoratus]|nr:hypothetical protein AcV5_004529 [Antrodia cinnamomea]